MTPDDLKPAKFRGIECAARDLGMMAGRRVVRDTVPGRDGDVFEDLGKMAREFNIQFVCAGEDWKETYNALIAAVEDRRPAQFQHPDGSIHTVVVDGGFEFSIVSVGEATVSGRLVVMTDANRVDVTADAVAAVETAADDVDDVASDTLTDNLTGGAAAATAIGRLTTGMRYAINLGKQAEYLVHDALDLIDDDLASLVSFPAVVASRLCAVYQDITDWPMLSQALSRYHDAELQRTADYGLVADPTARALVRNDHELNLACLHFAIAQMARVVNDTEYTAFDDAQSAVGTVAAWIDVAAVHSNAAQLAAMGDIQAQLVESVLNGRQQMPRLKDFVPWRVMSADEIAQYLYQDGTRAAEIVARNKIQHPGFIGPDVTLKVLEL